MWTHNVSEKIDWFDNIVVNSWKKIWVVIFIGLFFVSLIVTSATFFYFKAYNPKYSLETHIVFYAIATLATASYAIILFYLLDPTCVKIGFGERNFYLFNTARKVFKHPLIIQYSDVIGLLCIPSSNLCQFVYRKHNVVVWGYRLSKENTLRLQRKLQTEAEMGRWIGDLKIYNMRVDQLKVEIEANKYVPLSAWVKMMENKKNKVYWRE